jgi:hypothetical protein
MAPKEILIKNTLEKNIFSGSTKICIGIESLEAINHEKTSGMGRKYYPERRNYRRGKAKIFYVRLEQATSLTIVG